MSWHCPAVGGTTHQQEWAPDTAVFAQGTLDPQTGTVTLTFNASFIAQVRAGSKCVCVDIQGNGKGSN